MTTTPHEAYLVQFGLAGFLGRFQNLADREFVRADAVVVQSPRGLELGTILNFAPPATKAGKLAFDGGTLIRLATTADVVCQQKHTSRLHLLLAAVQSRLVGSDLPFAVLDGEVLLDGETAILHVLHWAECDASALFAELSQQHGLQILLHDLTNNPVPEKSGCGEANCGSSGCSSCGSSGGCSTGSCSSGKIKSADEMTAYFADLRNQMEHSKKRVALVT